MSGRRVLGGLATLSLALLLAHPAVASDLDRLESEFERAIKKVTPATVVCLPRDVEGNAASSSGVIISRKGLILSDGDAGRFRPKGKKRAEDDKWTVKIEIRIPSLKGKGFRSFPATVLHRDRKVDTCLIRIDKPPSGGFKPLELGDSDALRVGDFTFVMGNSFGLANEAPPTITAGVVAALVRFEKPDRTGAFETIYTSAAVNPGVNGGPIVDVDGRLIGTVSTSVGHNDRFQSMGKCVPMARLRAIYAKRPECADIFAKPTPTRTSSRMSAKLETVFHRTGRRCFSGVVSFDVTREGKFSVIAPNRNRAVMVPRYLGSMSGVLIDREGHILTSLYNLTNVTTLTNPGWAARAPYEALVAPGIEAIKSIRVHWADGSNAPAEVVGYSEYLGVAMLKADIKSLPQGVEPLRPAPATAYQAGRFVLALGNPYGAKRPEDPLLTVGVLSKEHPPNLEDRWASHWQTDAGCTDGNAGGAAVTLRGELIGVMNIWSPLSHGRNSGIGFVAPWPRIEPHLEALKTGRASPYLGVGWEANEKTGLVLSHVGQNTPAGDAGLRAGDRILELDERTVHNVGDALAALREHWAGDQIAVKVVRLGQEVVVNVTLGKRPAPKKPAADEGEDKPEKKDEKRKTPRPPPKDRSPTDPP